jgi:hypothetical protein
MRYTSHHTFHYYMLSFPSSHFVSNHPIRPNISYLSVTLARAPCCRQCTGHPRGSTDEPHSATVDYNLLFATKLASKKILSPTLKPLLTGLCQCQC